MWIKLIEQFSELRACICKRNLTILSSTEKRQIRRKAETQSHRSKGLTGSMTAGLPGKELAVNATVLAPVGRHSSQHPTENHWSCYRRHGLCALIFCDFSVRSIAMRKHWHVLVYSVGTRSACCPELSREQGFIKL